ncbi:MAG TPA: penicillin acylase family protein [Dongiaceae bacterium]|nr:penicillin acylase family protein [Dongiaceae bacterium]
MTTTDAPADRPHRLRRLVPRLIVGFATLVVLALAGAFLWGWLALRGSLPLVEGKIALAGLSAPVRVERDALGVPTLHGADRIDVARATGFVHAQERFFQMDLQRRAAAGELAALVGPALREEDRRVRVHRFRALAAQVMATAPADSRALITAYADGVNAGLAALRQPPFEYLVLRVTPEPWRPEDTVLTLCAMFLQLQDDGGRREIALGVLHDAMPQPMFDFLAPRGTEWDAPMVGGPIAMAPIPGPEVFDLRGSEAVARAPVPAGAGADDPFDRPIAGSNNWAVAGRRTADGGAIVANDMHLGLQIPNIWYRAALAWHEAGGERRVSGVTLPGTPVLVAGSTEAIAWGFTNTMGDWNDVVLIDVDPADPESYRTPDGSHRFAHLAETIRVKGGPDEALDVVETIWGPVIGRDPSGRPRVLRWVAHDPAGVNLEMWRLESAGDLDAALALAPGLGIPAQNFVVADASGRIGWTIAGRLPRRAGFDGRLPGSWGDGTRRWDGWLDAAETPRLVDPPEGILWSANARVVDGAALALVGDDGYDLGARAGQIRDDLRAIDRAAPADMLKIQLDDRAVFLERWRALLEGVLDRAAAAADAEAGEAASPRAEARRLLHDWDGRASIDSVAYRLVRGFRSTLSVDLFDALTERCRAADPDFRYGRIGQREGPLWALVSAQPAHLLNPRYATWDQQLLASFDRLLADLTRDGKPLAEKTWGRRNLAAIRHPLSLAVPQLGAWLDMPPDPLPGDDNMPRVQAPDMGASERFAVSPGREAEGYLHMPGGQSGHPLSPHYRDAQAAWVKGEATPFLPGPAVETLILEPSGDPKPVR